MIKYYIIIALLVFSGTLAAQNKQSSPAAAVPKAMTGHWQKGVFSLSSFEEYNGKYVGPANETSLSYVIDASGKGREYFISNINSYNCRTQILGYREGQVIVNTADNSFEFRPTSGYYTTLTCMSKTATRKPYGANDLYPAYKTKCTLQTGPDGQPEIVNDKGLRLKKLE